MQEVAFHTNIPSLQSQSDLYRSRKMLRQSVLRLSSGLRINTSADNIGGFSMTTRMSARIRGLNQAVNNANKGIAIAQTADNGLEKSIDILYRIREFAVKAINNNPIEEELIDMQYEVNKLSSQLDDIANNTKFQKHYLLNGDFTDKLFLVGADSNQMINLTIQDARRENMGIDFLSLQTEPDEENRLNSDGDISKTRRGSNYLLLNNGVGADEDLTITGSLGTATIIVNEGDTAKIIAEEVNAEKLSTGVEAEAVTYAKLYDLRRTGTVSFTLHGESFSSFITADIADDDDLTSLADAINNAPGNTEITATLTSDNSGIILYNPDGYNIGIESYDHTKLSGTIKFIGLKSDGITTSGQAVTIRRPDSAIVGGNIIFKSEDSFNVAVDVGHGGHNNGIFDVAGSTYSSEIYIDPEEDEFYENYDLLGIINDAIDYLSDIQSNVNSFQNRVELTASGLWNESENMNVSRSRIITTDYANEITNLTKAQILLNISSAMLIQANFLPEHTFSIISNNNDEDAIYIVEVKDFEKNTNTMSPPDYNNTFEEEFEEELFMSDLITSNTTDTSDYGLYA
ncbi:flagellin [Candidatus Magnetomoraceae bacterium gMMP-1]